MGLNFFGYTPKLADFAARVSRDVGDLSFWSSVHPSVIENSKDRLLRTFRSCKGDFCVLLYSNRCLIDIVVLLHLLRRGEGAA